MVTLGVSGLLLTVDPASSKRAVKELQILLEPYKEKIEILEMNSDEECEEDEESSQEEQEQEVLPPVGYGTDTSSSLAAELAAELDGFRGQGRGGDESGGEKRIQMYDDEGNFIMPTDEDDKNNHNKKKHTGPRKEKRDWRSEWFSSLETNCKGHIFINIPRKKTKEDIAKEEAKRALKELIDKQFSDAAATAAAAGGDVAAIGSKRPREEGGGDDNDNDHAEGGSEDGEEEEGGVLDLTALLGGGSAAPATTAETPTATTEGATTTTTVAEDGTTTTTEVTTTTAVSKPVPHQMVAPNLRVPALVDLLLDNLSADPRPVCRFAYRMYPVWSTCYPTTATILACCKELATTIEIPEGQSAAKVGIHLAIKNNTAVDKEKNYLRAAIESTLVGTRKCIVLPRFSGSNMTIEVDCVMTIMVMHSICCVGIQTKYHSKYGRRGYNLHSFSKGSMNLADSTTPTATATTPATADTPAVAPTVSAEEGAVANTTATVE